MKLSTIIPTFNEANDISACIESLIKQSYKDLEIIIVDDGSTDQTLNILSELKINNLKLKIIHSEHVGTGAARNLGTKKATGKIFVFVDADMTFDHFFLKSLVKPIIDGKSKGTFSRDEFVSNWENIWAKCWNINEGWEAKKRHPKNYPDIQPVFRAILSSEFNRVSGFTPGGYDDDWSLSKKLGYGATAAPNAIFYHKNPESLKEVFYHAKWVGKRKYKFGLLGFLTALIRASLPVSILIGIYKSLISHNLRFLIFKVVYDFGIFVGISEFIINKKKSK